ncbi:MAG: hypothetical protein NTZ79_06950 [Proteobacteria bacterium]|nr:hypothetical protein [Pseudomonadota bacterium]
MPRRLDQFRERQVSVERVRLLFAQRGAADDRVYYSGDVRLQGTILRWRRS